MRGAQRVQIELIQLCPAQSGYDSLEYNYELLAEQGHSADYDCSNQRNHDAILNRGCTLLVPL